MTTGWLPYWDDSFSPVPVSRLGEMYAAGFRVWARYVAAGTSGKWWTDAEIAAWFALGGDTGVWALFEGKGDEPVTSPLLGGQHAREARTAARAHGWPDRVALSPAMDTNVDAAQWTGPIATYMRGWRDADVPPVPYIEADAGGYLYAQGLTAGTFVPAAYAWNVPAVLYTPDNAPAHVVATQEHNGRQMAGGTVDIGHIRTAAQCVWWNPAPPADVPPGGTMPTLDATDLAALWGYKPGWPGLPAETPLGMLADIHGGTPDAAAFAALQAELDAVKAQGVANGQALSQILALLQAPVVTSSGVTAAQVAAADRAAADVLDPPAAP